MKSLLTLILALVALSAHAQPVVFSDNINTWKVLNYAASPGANVFNYSYSDTVTIGGRMYRKLMYQLHADPDGPLATHAGSGIAAYIREDFSVQKVYARFSLVDTDKVLYDYSLAVGDTFRFTDSVGHTTVHVVAGVDTISVGTMRRRLWHFTAVPTDHSADYDVIDGLGSVQDPLWPATTNTFENSSMLTCFTTSGAQPIVAPQVNAFNNTTSCSLAVPSPFSIAQQVTVVPDPAGSNGRLVMARPILSGSVAVYSVLGQLVYTAPLAGGTSISLSHISVPGMYSYIVADNTTGEKVSGHFIFQ